MYTFYGFHVDWWFPGDDYIICARALSFYFMHLIVTDIVFSEMSVAGCSKGGLENTGWCVRGCHHSRTHRHGFLGNWANQVQGITKAFDKFWSKFYCFLNINCTNRFTYLSHNKIFAWSKMYSLYFRRSYFEIFWFTHHLFIIFFIGLIVHGFE